MSLTYFVKIPEVVARLKTVRPAGSRKIDVPLRAPPRTNHYSLVGMAFDYLLRFELERRAPHATSTPWVAEEVPDLIWKQFAGVTVGRDILAGVPFADYIEPEEIAKRARHILDNARKALTSYLKRKNPSQTQTMDLAAHAIRLAGLETVYRAGLLDPHFEKVEAEDVKDLAALLAIVPFDRLLHAKVMLLNPAFGESSELVGGADADLICGDLLLDFKTTKDDKVRTHTLDQLLGYVILCRRQRAIQRGFPAVKRAGFYFARHGHLWELSTEVWTQRPEFLEIEQWFIEHAKRTFAGLGAC